MKSNRIVLIAALSPAIVLVAAAQTPVPAPPPPPPDAMAPLAPPAPMALTGTPATHTSRVNAVVYGPQGEVQALTLRDGVAVSLPPDLGMRLHATVTKGARVQVSGNQQIIAGQTSLVAQSVTANGQTFVATQPDRGPGLAGVAPPPPPSPAGPYAPRGPRGRRGPGAPPRPPDGVAPPPPLPVGAGGPPPPPPPDGASPPAPPPAGAPVPPPPQM